MVALGLILLVLSGLLTAGVVLSNTSPVHAEAFGVTLANVSLGGLFLVGVVTGVVFGLGLSVALAGAARKRAQRLGLKRQVQHVRGERESLAEENARLQEELDRQRSESVPPAGASGAEEPGDGVAAGEDTGGGGKHGLHGR